MNLPTEAAITAALAEIRKATRASMTNEPLMLSKYGIPGYALTVLRRHIERAYTAGDPRWARHYWAEAAAIAVRNMVEAEP